jgi:hypothetical protein
MAGKGDTPRPFAVDDKTFSDNWERTFGAKAESSPHKESKDGEAADHRDAGAV